MYCIDKKVEKGLGRGYQQMHKFQRFLHNKQRCFCNQKICSLVHKDFCNNTVVVSVTMSKLSHLVTLKNTFMFNPFRLIQTSI